MLPRRARLLRLRLVISGVVMLSCRTRLLRLVSLRCRVQGCSARLLRLIWFNQSRQRLSAKKWFNQSRYRSRESAYYDGESFPTITYPCKSLPTYTMTAPPTNMNQGGCPMKAIPKELPAGYKAAAGKSPPPIFPPDYRPRAPAATLAAVDEPPAAPPPPFPQMQ